MSERRYNKAKELSARLEHVESMPTKAELDKPENWEECFVCGTRHPVYMLFGSLCDECERQRLLEEGSASGSRLYTQHRLDA